MKIKVEDPPKTCSRCPYTGPRSTFPTALSHWHRIVRSWCLACLRLYHRLKSRKVRLCADCGFELTDEEWQTDGVVCFACLAPMIELERECV